MNKARSREIMLIFVFTILISLVGPERIRIVRLAFPDEVSSAIPTAMDRFHISFMPLPTIGQLDHVVQVSSEGVAAWSKLVPGAALPQVVANLLDDDPPQWCNGHLASRGPGYRVTDLVYDGLQDVLQGVCVTHAS